MWIFSNIRDYFGNHVENITTEQVTINDFALGELTVLDVVEYDDEDNGLGYSIEVAETVTKGLIKVRTATALGRGYYSIGSVTPIFSAEWSAYVCVTTENTVNSAAWSNYVCELEIAKTITVDVEISWVDIELDADDGMAGVVTLKDNLGNGVDSDNITMYSKAASVIFTVDETTGGYKVSLGGIMALLGGFYVDDFVRYRIDGGSWVIAHETTVFTTSVLIDVEVKTTVF